MRPCRRRVRRYRARSVPYAEGRQRGAGRGRRGVGRRPQRRRRRTRPRFRGDRAAAARAADAQGRAAAGRPADPDQAARHRDPPRGRDAVRGTRPRCRGGDGDDAAIGGGGLGDPCRPRRHGLHRCDRVRPDRPLDRDADRLGHGRAARSRGGPGARRRIGSGGRRHHSSLHPANLGALAALGPDRRPGIAAHGIADRPANRRRLACRRAGGTSRSVPRRIAPVGLSRRRDRHRRAARRRRGAHLAGARGGRGRPRVLRVAAQ